MELILAKTAGFCIGVERSVEMAQNSIKSGKEVYILGSLVHNKHVVERLQQNGIKVVERLEDIPDTTKAVIIISAHGVPPAIYEEIKNKRLDFVDTTCPPVLKIHRIVQTLVRNGYTVVIIGDKGHTEVKGILGWAGNAAYVVEKESDISNIPYSHKIGVVAQTTQSKEKFDYFVEKLKAKGKEFISYNTICDATRNRQEDVLNLTKQADVILVIGDPGSANTKRLAEIASNAGIETHRIASVEDLDFNWIYGKNKIGITAGASTPSWIINDVVEKLKNLEKK